MPVAVREFGRGSEYAVRRQVERTQNLCLQCVVHFLESQCMSAATPGGAGLVSFPIAINGDIPERYCRCNQRVVFELHCIVAKGYAWFMITTAQDRSDLGDHVAQGTVPQSDDGIRERPDFADDIQRTHKNTLFADGRMRSR